MKYLESAIKFLIKNWILALPLFVLLALGALIGGAYSSAAGLSGLFTNYGDITNFTDAGKLFSSLTAVLSVLAVGSGIWSLIFNFVGIPATYGLVNKRLETGSASLNDLGSAISQNFVKYVMYFIGMLVVSLALGVGFFIIMLIFGLLSTLVKPLVILTILIGLALALAIAVLMILLSMWLSAMIVDGLDVIAAAKKSIEIVKTCFWTVVGISILVTIACGIIGFILSFLSLIPLIGPIIASIVPAVQTFVMLVFFLLIYRERTGRMNNL